MLGLSSIKTYRGIHQQYTTKYFQKMLTGNFNWKTHIIQNEDYAFRLPQMRNHHQKLVDNL